MFIRTLFRRCFAVTIAALVVLLSASGAGAITLTDTGKTDYIIVVADDAISPEKTAAEELQRYLKLVTDVDFPIKEESKGVKGHPQILIGQSKRVNSLLKGFDWKSLEQDGIVIKTVGDNLILAGGRPRGTLYAVYTFLEDQVGIRWWTSTESAIPKWPTLQIGQLNVKYTPKFKYRESHYLDTNKNPLFDVKLKLNGHMYQIPESYGGHYEIIGWCHTFHLWIPPKKYFAKHPEWFSMVGGKRTADGAQLCLTNDELVHEMAKVCIGEIKKKPTAGIISVTQNDWGGKCECEKCKAIEEEEGSPSGPIIRFVNAVAEEIEKECPGTLVETLAYLYSRKAPLKVKPRDNVIVRLCSIDCNFARRFDDDANKAFRDDLQKWASITKNLYIWDYVTNFGNYIPPQPNMKILAPNLRLFEKNNVIAVFEQGDAECSVGDFVRYRNWLLAHLMWDPSLDEKKLTREFLNGYYGPAGKYIEKYFDVINDAAKRKDGLGCIHGDVWTWNLEEMTKAKILLDQAEKAVARNKVLAERVRRDRMPLDMVWLQRYAELKDAAEDAEKPFVGPKDPRAATQDFIARLKQWNVKSHVYITSIKGFIEQLETWFVPLPTVEKLNQTPKEDVIEIQEDKFQLANPGEWSSLVDDKQASNGKAAGMPANHGQWAVQCRIPEEVVKANPGKWNWYVIIRCDALKKNGSAFHYGVFDEVAGATSDAAERIGNAGDGKYRVYALGARDLTSKVAVWVAPYANPDAVKNVYVDRIVLVRERK